MSKRTHDQDLHSIFSDVERDIANLETELKNLEIKKNKLRELVAYHITNECPEYYKRVFEGYSCLLDPDKKTVENMFMNQEEMCQDVLGYSFSLKNYSFEQMEDKLVKNWEIHGKVGENSFIVQFMTETGITKKAVVSTNISPVTIRSLEIFPLSESVTNLANEIKKYNHLQVLVPSLHFYQKLQTKRNEVVEWLADFKEIFISQEDDCVLIVIKIEGLEFGLQWDITFREENYKYFDRVQISAEETEVCNLPEGHDLLPYLLREKILQTSEEVSQFFRNFFDLS